MRTPDAVVVGSGPNGLAAAITLARAGLAVDVIEGAQEPGGGCRSCALTLPGYLHDVCSAVHPLAAASPFFAGIDLAARGARLAVPPVAFAHPLDGGRAAAVTGSVADTAELLGADDGAYRRLMGPLVRDAAPIVAAFLAPLRRVPSRPLAAARFAGEGLLPARLLARRLHTGEGQALIAGLAAHSMLPLTAPVTGGFGLLLGLLAHTTGWPVVAGGSGRLIDALTAELAALGGRVETGRWVRRVAELAPARAVLLDVSPRQLASIAADRLPARYLRALGRFRYGPGVCKVDWALAGPVPWTAQACRQTATVHLGGTLEEIAASEAEVNAGRHAEHPYCIVTQPCVADPERAPAGRHTLWAYCHVPSGSPVDVSASIEAQIERFAPGFRDLILARRVRVAADMADYDPNYVGGDINGGAGTLAQTLLRPVPRWNPYRTPARGLYLCSASAPPGGGVHGMCGVWAARTALRDLGVHPAGAMRRLPAVCNRHSVDRHRKVAVLGPIPRDQIVTNTGKRFEKYGCVLYTAVALSALLGADDTIVPISHVRQDDEAPIKEILAPFPNIDTSGITSAADQGDATELRYIGHNRRVERQTSFMNPILPADVSEVLDADMFVCVPITDYEVGQETLQHIKEHSSATVVLDAHGPATTLTSSGERLARVWADQDGWLPYVDILKMNLEEAGSTWLGESGEMTADPDPLSERTDLRGLAHHCLDRGVGAVCVTLDERGCVAFYRDGSGEVADELVGPVPVERVVDTTGAGDSFAAGLAYGYLEYRDYVVACQYGNAMGAQRCTGAELDIYLPREETDQQLLATYGRRPDGQGE